MKAGSILLVSMFFALAVCQRVTASPPEPPKPVARESVETPEIERPRFKLYKTQNVSTVLLLDSRTGRLWQAHVAIGEKGFTAVLPISTEVLANGQDGRFTLMLTENIWNSVLLDTNNGRLWRCQFSFDVGKRFCMPIDTNGKD